MNARKYAIASIAVGAWIFFYSFIVDATFWAELAAYANPNLIRPEGQDVLGATVVSCFLQGLALCFIFVKGCENKGIGEGIRFGWLVALFVVSFYLLFSARQPWGLSVTIIEMTSAIIKYVVAGAVLGAMYGDFVIVAAECFRRPTRRSVWLPERQVYACPYDSGGPETQLDPNATAHPPINPGRKLAFVSVAAVTLVFALGCVVMVGFGLKDSLSQGLFYSMFWLSIGGLILLPDVALFARKRRQSTRPD